MNKTNKKILIYFIILLIIALDYPLVDKYIGNAFENYELGVVERAVDGDTVKVNGSSIRLLGINTPEKGEAYYQEAKEFTANITEGQLVKLVSGKQDKDLYGRKLRYLFLNGENVNLKLVQEGLAGFYFPSGKDQYYSEFKSAWLQCLASNKNLCEPSSDKCASCIVLRELNVEKQYLVLANNCSFSCNLEGWSLKDEGMKKFIFPEFALKSEVKVQVGNGKNTKDELFWTGESYVWTKTGDSLFLRDKNQKLVLWHGY
ncbi:thermonuclease family protein [Candidatus Pacearchaeota archaeon]|nr:thermonuclease family protein [Candidatus Pacearchaeota archaeon]